MENFVALSAIVIILGCAIGYIVKAKRNGVHCIGCPAGGTCSGHCPSKGEENSSENK